MKAKKADGFRLHDVAADDGDDDENGQDDVHDHGDVIVEMVLMSGNNNMMLPRKIMAVPMPLRLGRVVALLLLQWW